MKTVNVLTLVVSTANLVAAAAFVKIALDYRSEARQEMEDFKKETSKTVRKMGAALAAFEV